MEHALRFQIRARAQELKEKALLELEVELESALKFQFSLDQKSQTAQILAEKLEKMAEQRKALRCSLEGVKDRLDAAGEARAVRSHLEDNLEKFNRGWKKATPILRKRLLRRMIDCLIYTPEGIKAFCNANILVEAQNQSKQTKKPSETIPWPFLFFGVNQSYRRLLADSIQNPKCLSHLG